MNNKKAIKGILILLLISIISSVLILTMFKDLWPLILFFPFLFVFFSIAIFSIKYFVIALVFISIWLISGTSLDLLSTVILLAILLIYAILGFVIKNKRKRLLILALIIIGVLGSYHFYYYYPQHIYKAVFDKHCGRRENGIYTCYMKNNTEEIPKVEAYCRSLGLNVIHPHFDHYDFLCYDTLLYNWDNLEERYLVPYCDHGMCIE